MTATQQKRKLALAARAGDAKTAAALLSENRELAQAWEPMMHACFEGHHAIVKLLLESGADPNRLSGSAWAHRPLHRVVEHKIATLKHDGHRKTVRLLLDFGADPLRRATRPPMTAIALAAIAGETQMLGLLTATGQALDIFDSAATGDAVRVRHWLENDPSLAYTIDEAGCNALWYCAASRLSPAGVHECARLLLDAGSAVNHTAKGATPLYFAVAHAMHPSLAQLLLDRGADPHAGVSLLHAACAFHFEFLTEGLRWLIARGADPNRADENGQTALHKAALCGYIKAARCLVELGADPDRADSRGLRAADVARLNRKRWL